MVYVAKKGGSGQGSPPEEERAQPEIEPLLARRDKSGVVWSQLPRAYLSRRNSGTDRAIARHRKSMIPAFNRTAAGSPKCSAMVAIQRAPTGKNPKNVTL